MKPKYIVGTLAAIALLVVAVLSVEQAKTEYMSFNKAELTSSRAQIAGTWVPAGGSEYKAESNQFIFRMTDNQGTQQRVVYHGAKPNNFEIAESIVVTGQMEDGVFRASHILTKCPSKYEADSKDLGI